SSNSVQSALHILVKRATGQNRYLSRTVVRLICHHLADRNRRDLALTETTDHHYGDNRVNCPSATNCPVVAIKDSNCQLKAVEWWAKQCETDSVGSSWPGTIDLTRQ